VIRDPAQNEMVYIRGEDPMELYNKDLAIKTGEAAVGAD